MKLNKLKSLSLLGLILLAMSAVAVVNAKEQSMDEMWGNEPIASTEVSEKLQWFVDDNYSMFIHWGLYSSMEGVWKGKTHYGIGEWIMHMAKIPVDEYKAHAKNFNPDKFDATAIVKLAKDAGMRCIVITAKHHEGFAMFDSKASDFTITKATPFGRDPMKELAEACKKEGIRLGFYYSQNQDWTEPNGGNYKGTRPEGYKPEDFEIYFNEKVVPQVTELLTNYGDIGVVWFDTPGNMDKKYSAALVDLVNKYQPDCLINSRIGNGFGDYSSLGDMHIPLTQNAGPWETVDTTNDSWAYAWYDEHWKSAKKIASNVVEVVARGGTYMLNVGPRGDGSIPQDAVDNLTDAGTWIKANAEAIYGADASPFSGFSWGDCTVKGNNLYLHVFDWPKSGKLIIPNLKHKVKSASLLCCGVNIDVLQSEKGIELLCPSLNSKNMIPVIKLELSGKPEAVSSALFVDGQYPTKLEAVFSKVEGCAHKVVKWMEKFGEWKHSDNVGDWKKSTDLAKWQVNILEAGKYNVKVVYGCYPSSDSSEWIIKSNDDSISFVALDSGMRKFKKGEPRFRARYMTVELGVLSFDKTGVQLVTVGPRGAPQGDGFLIERIIIEPYE